MPLQNGGQKILRVKRSTPTPEVECYNACSDAWGQNIKGSLFKLLTEGKGMPGIKEVGNAIR